MKHRKLFWHILPANLIVTIAALVAVTLYSETALRQFYITSLTADLTSRANLIVPQVTNLLISANETKLNNLCRRIGQKSKTRITVIKTSGVVAADSEEYPANMSNHSNRPEVKVAMQGAIGTSIRFSATIGTNMLYVALPVKDLIKSSNIVYILRTSMPVSAIDQQLHSIRKTIMAGAIIVSLLAAFIVTIISRRISKPLEELTEQAEKFAEEDFSAPFTTSPISLEVAALSSAMNHMAEQIKGRISTIIRQRNELQTILNSMVESVIVVDQDQNIVNINASANLMFSLPTTNSKGRNIQGLIRNQKLNQQLDCLQEHSPVSEIISVNQDGEELFLQGSAASLCEGEKNIGAVLVFNDITKIKKLENMRRDFVANVSHELMTPLTSIKGYSETVYDLIYEDTKQSKEFLKIIIKQSDKLRAIVDDLLQLARLEQETDHPEISRSSVCLADLINASILSCSSKAAENSIRIVTDCPAQIMVNIESALIEQAVVNLLTNAIKYSENGSQVEIICELRQGKESENIAIIVRDHGPGIAQKHLARIFERFYRCDKARNRKSEEGGTGLGLAIVKHIVQLHHGRVWVESRINEGSTFIIEFPC
jgi:two-component system phosphate regulon sensor histidine kinase PhoR